MGGEETPCRLVRSDLPLAKPCNVSTRYAPFSMKPMAACWKGSSWKGYSLAGLSSGGTCCNKGMRTNWSHG